MPNLILSFHLDNIEWLSVGSRRKWFIGRWLDYGYILNKQNILNFYRQNGGQCILISFNSYSLTLVPLVSWNNFCIRDFLETVTFPATLSNTHSWKRSVNYLVATGVFQTNYSLLQEWGKKRSDWERRDRGMQANEKESKEYQRGGWARWKKR